jgi:hypothetical protein
MNVEILQNVTNKYDVIRNNKQFIIGCMFCDAINKMQHFNNKNNNSKFSVEKSIRNKFL